jgi:hypothetical protein
MVLIVIVGSINSSIEYNRAKEGITINIKIILGKTQGFISIKIRRM